MHSQIVEHMGLTAKSADSSSVDLLLGEVGRLFAALSPDVGPVRFREIEQILTILCKTASNSALANLSRQIAPLDYSPQGLVKALAFHEQDDVAAPTIEFSPVLNTADLSALIQTMPSSRAALVAGRPNLRAPHCGQLLELNSLDVQFTLAQNLSAELSVLDLVRLADVARREPRLVPALSKRARLPMAVVDQLAKIGLAHVTKLAVPSSVKPAHLEKPTIKSDVADDQYDDAEKLIRPLIESQDLSEIHLRRFALKGDFYACVLVLAYLTKTRRRNAQEILTAQTPKQFLLLARLSEFSSSTVCALLAIGPWRQRLSRLQRQAAINQFRAITPTDARLMLAPVAA